VATLHLFAANAIGPRRRAGCLVGSRFRPGGLAHLLGMDTKTHGQHVSDRPQLTLIEQVLSLSELCAHLQVPAQTIYDLRSQGRGPRGFRVGRELRFRISEVEAWLERMEQDDERRHDWGRP
jgi:excisionase family DNA binding protein